MKQSRDGTQGGEQPVGPGASSQAGKSGEGSRSALEHLIQQERKRDAQRPRDGASPADGDRG